MYYFSHQYCFREEFQTINKKFPNNQSFSFSIIFIKMYSVTNENSL